MWNLIMIGGISNIGKSLLVDKLITLQPDIFSRPLSYTTRKKRGITDNEYNFVTPDEFTQLEESFLTIDSVYKYKYAISKSSIMGLLERGCIPIKEIHADNHLKIKKLLPNVLSIILLPKNIDNFHKKNSTSNRIKEDKQNFILNKDSYNKYPFDLTYYIDESIDIIVQIETITKKVLEKLSNFTEDIKVMDNINRANYNLISSEFTEEKRVTTKNFHDISEKYFLDSFSKYINKDHLNILEIGCGQGYLTNILIKYLNKNNIKYNNYVCIDISEDMIGITEERFNKSRVSFHNLPVSEIKSLELRYDVIVSSLSDPFLTKESLSLISEILLPNGNFISNIPTKEWSENIHSNKFITFKSEKFSSVKVISNVYNISELKSLIVESNLGIKEFYSLYNNLSSSISIDIEDYNNIPILYFFIVGKN